MNRRSSRGNFRFVIVCVHGLVAGCSVGTASRIHVDDEAITDIEASDVDLRAMTQKMASSIIELPAIAGSPDPVHVGFLNIENRTLTTDFDSYNLLSKIRQHLIEYSEGKIVFLDQEKLEAVLAERDIRRSQERIPGIDYFLTGYAYSMRKADGKGTMQGYHRYSFRLTDAQRDTVVWEKDYEFKKQGRRGMAYR